MNTMKPAIEKSSITLALEISLRSIKRREKYKNKELQERIFEYNT